MDPQTQLDWLRSPSKSLPALGRVLDQKTAQFVQYDPTRLTYNLQRVILDYYDSPPLTQSGQFKWLTVLCARQTGKSLTGEYAAYPKVAFTRGLDHCCICDIKARAEYLHNRVHQLHDNWPEQYRTPTVSAREQHQLTFDPRIGGKMRTLSAETSGVGVGQSVDSFHGSECHLWSDFGGTMSFVYPAMINRDRCYALFESTPWEAGCDWHNHCIDAKQGIGRHTYYFAPFWDGKLNTRPWRPEWGLDTEEQGLLAKYGPEGLTVSNLAFRREIMNTDSEIRRNPALFNIFYPFDDISCWSISSNSAIPGHALARHQNSALREFSGEYFEMEAPDSDGIYVMGVDPCGYAARDHAAFHVFRMYEDKIIQVARYAGHTEPVKFTEILLKTAKRYNRCMIAVESNGVGQAVLALIRQTGYQALYYDKPGRPGFTSSAQSLDKALGWLIDSLMDNMVLWDKQTVEQLMTYKHDKRIEESATTELIRGQASSRRRERHHWDLVSALIFTIAASRKINVPHIKAPAMETGESPVHPGVYTFQGQNERWKAQRAASKQRNKPTRRWH